VHPARSEGVGKSSGAGGLSGGRAAASSDELPAKVAKYENYLTPLEPPRIVRLLDLVPRLRSIPARLIGLGVRPEHVRSPAITEPLPRSVP
jgi:hypothetical protein